jgi:hypothetical protein
MAEERGRPREFLSKLADVGEEAIQRVGEMPGAGFVTEGLSSMRDRLDDMQRRVRGIDQLEHRLTTLEGRVDELARRGAPSRPAPARKAAETRRTAASPRASSARKKPPPSS